MGRKFSNIMMMASLGMIFSATTVTPSFINSFDYTNNPSMNNSKKHKAKVKKAKARRNKKTLMRNLDYKLECLYDFVTVTPSFINSFDYTNNPSMNNSKKHKAKVKKAKARRNKKR